MSSSVDGMLLVATLYACKVPASEDLASRAPLDERVDAFLDEHGLEPLDCGVVEYTDGCSEESTAAIECFSKAEASCSEARLDTVSSFAGPASPFYVTYILWGSETGCVMELMTYSVDAARDGDDAFGHSTCSAWEWHVYKYTMCEKLKWAPGDCG